MFMNVLKTFWAEAIQAVAYLKNRMPTQILSFQSPLKTLCLDTPLFSLALKTFGCICYVHVSKSDCTKLDPKALKCVFLGYSADQKWYKCFHALIRKKFVSWDVTFFKFTPFFSLGKTPLQGEITNEELSSSISNEELSSSISFLVPIHPYYFDNDVSGKGRQNSKCTLGGKRHKLRNICNKMIIKFKILVSPSRSLIQIQFLKQVFLLPPLYLN